MDPRKKTSKDKIKEGVLAYLGESKIDHLKFEEISKMAGVARKTIYNHYENRMALIEDIVIPVLQYCDQAASRLLQEEKVGLEEIADLCYDIWSYSPRVLPFLFHMDIKASEEIFALHRQYTSKFISLFQKAIPSMTKEKSRQYAILAFKLFVPYFESTQFMDNPTGGFSKILYQVTREENE